MHPKICVTDKNDHMRYSYPGNKSKSNTLSNMINSK